MSMISEQVKQIRDVADSYREMKCDICTQKVLYEAADTIEALSAKVREQNLPAHGEWVFKTNIPIRDGASSAGYVCSVCGCDVFRTEGMNFCPNCGAKME